MATKRATPKSRMPVQPEDDSPSGLVAAEILARYGDLAPSVKRIMQAELSDAGRLHAITLFRESLSSPSDPMRNPVGAIAAGQAIDG